MTNIQATVATEQKTPAETAEKTATDEIMQDPKVRVPGLFYHNATGHLGKIVSILKSRFKVPETPELVLTTGGGDKNGLYEPGSNTIYIFMEEEGSPYDEQSFFMTLLHEIAHWLHCSVYPSARTEADHKKQHDVLWFKALAETWEVGISRKASKILLATSKELRIGRVSKTFRGYKPPPPAIDTSKLS